MGEEAEEEDYSSAGCSVSLMCQEDSADLDGGELVLVYSDAEEEDDEEEYMDHLVSKETSFCCSPSSSSSSSSLAFSDAEPAPLSMAAEDWFRCACRDTVKWILETRAYFGFSHRTAYLAVSYFDRFCLRRCIDRSVVPWATRLLAVACTSLAAKMEEYRAPPLPEFRASGHDFCCASIRRMELLVLSTLDWRMGDVTPFDYLPCLCARLRRTTNGGGAGGGMVAAKAAALIFSTTEAASVLDYRPSTVAAAAVLAATHGALTKEALESKMMISFSRSFLLEKEDVFACYSSMLSEESSPATNRRSAKRPPSCSSDSTCANDDPATADLADAASFSAATATNNNNKRMRRLEVPATHR